MYWRRRLTRLELALYALIVSTAIALFLERALWYMEAAERASMQATVSRVNSALQVRAARDMLAGLAARRGTAPFNPFTEAATPPPNYLGEFEAPDLGALERGAWIYDRSRGVLVYLPRLRQGLQTEAPESSISFRTDLARAALVPDPPFSWDGR